MGPANWSTAAGGEPAHTRPAELSALGEHLGACCARSGRLFGLCCSAQRLHDFLAPRLVSTGLVVALLILGGGALMSWW
jgi:hypothetical protein